MTEDEIADAAAEPDAPPTEHIEASPYLSGPDRPSEPADDDGEATTEEPTE